jgi:hypothetical protein
LFFDVIASLLHYFTYTMEPDLGGMIWLIWRSVRIIFSWFEGRWMAIQTPGVQDTCHMPLQTPSWVQLWDFFFANCQNLDQPLACPKDASVPKEEAAVP